MRRSAPFLAAVLAAVTFIPLVLLTVLTLRQSSEAVREEARARMSATATLAAAAVDAELRGLREVADSFAGRPSLVDAFRANDPAAMTLHLRELRTTRPGIEVAFAADLRGRLIEIAPATPEIVGNDFSFRDWYRGVTRTKRAYVSRAYVTQARGRERVVAAAVLVRDPRPGASRRPLGILVAAYGAKRLSESFRRLPLPRDSALTVTDQGGSVITRTRAGESDMSLATDSRVQKALSGQVGIEERAGAVSAWTPVEGSGWTVVAEVPTDVAYAGVNRLRSEVLAIAGVLTLALLLGWILLTRTLLSRARAERALAARNAELAQASEELDRQNTELELQTAELEDNHARLEAANEELSSQQQTLERALSDLEASKERVETLFGFAERLARETDPAAVAEMALEELCDYARAEIGVLYATAAEADDECEIVATRGVDARKLSARLERREGLAGRALEEQRPVEASYGETGLRLAAFGDDVATRRELHIPLSQGGRAIGVATVARMADQPFTDEEIATLESLAAQAAVALANAAAFAQTVRLANVNRAVLDATTEGIFLVDPDGQLLVANRAILEMGERGSGERSQEGNVYDRLASAAEEMENPENFRAHVEGIRADPERETSVEYTIAATCQSIKHYTAPVRDAEGALIGRIFVARDITAERQAERLKNELVATVSHELRTPLTGVLGFSELLLDPGLDEEARATYLRTIHDEALRLSALVNDFLDLQRIEEGHFTLSLEPFDLGDLVRQSAQLFSAQSSQHSFEVAIDDEPLVVIGERDRMAQVLANLMSNAVKYSPAGGTVRVSAQLHDDSVRVEVSDSGLGIPEAQRGRVFEKFFRVDSSDTRRIGGTGLGLALAKEIVDAHAGRLGFDSVEGEGTTFWLELPNARSASASSGTRVLIVEDDPAAALLLATMLAEDGLETEIATSGREALVRAAADPPALVCLDIGLAGDLDGWDVLERLKAEAATADVPVVVCTAGDGSDHATALGASDFITKPFTHERLRAALARVLPNSGSSVLIVDDDPTMRRLVIESLRGNGIRVREAGDGEEALAAIAAERPDAILLDLMMPGLDGFAVLERLQRQPHTRRLPVLVLTSKQLTREERRSLSRQTAVVLQKSAYSAPELRRLISSALGR